MNHFYKQVVGSLIFGLIVFVISLYSTVLLAGKLEFSNSADFAKSYIVPVNVSSITFERLTNTGSRASPQLIESGESFVLQPGESAIISDFDSDLQEINFISAASGPEAVIGSAANASTLTEPGIQEFKEEIHQANTSGGELPIASSVAHKKDKVKNGAKAKKTPSVVPPKGNEKGMFSKLVFVVDDKEIEFPAYELIQIAHDVVKSEMYKNKEVPMPKKEEYDHVFDIMIEEVMGDMEVNESLIIPPHVSGLDDIKKWLFVAEYFRKNGNDESLRGWWVEIAGRLLLIKNHCDEDSISITICDEETIKKTKGEEGKDLSKNFFLYKKGDEWFVFANNIDDALDDYDVTKCVQKVKKMLKKIFLLIILMNSLKKIFQMKY